jgi:endonuclease III
MTKQPRFGGSFAPPLSQEKLAAYKVLASNAPPRIKDAMNELIVMVSKFKETPDSTLSAQLHPSGAAMVVPLEKQEVDRIWDFVPWDDELATMNKVFESIPKGELRNAAYHLLWFGRELCNDREPLTTDKL